jgi:hypothetical protein
MPATCNAEGSAQPLLILTVLPDCEVAIGIRTSAPDETYYVAA